jgi:hypothetical protein
MAENESVEVVEEAVAEVVEVTGGESEEVTTPAADPESEEKPWLFGQTPSMWFLIDSAVVLLIVIIMRVRLM